MHNATRLGSRSTACMLEIARHSRSFVEAAFIKLGVVIEEHAVTHFLGLTPTDWPTAMNPAAILPYTQRNIDTIDLNCDGPVVHFEDRYLREVSARKQSRQGAPAWPARTTAWATHFLRISEHI